MDETAPSVELERRPGVPLAWKLWCLLGAPILMGWLNLLVAWIYHREGRPGAWTSTILYTILGMLLWGFVFGLLDSLG